MTTAKLNEGIALQKIITECDEVIAKLKDDSPSPAIPTTLDIDTMVNMLGQIVELRKTKTGADFTTAVKEIIDTEGVAFFNALNTGLTTLKTDTQADFTALEAS